MGCKGNCGSCTGCGRALELTGQELSLMERLGELAFLPVGRRLGEDWPIYPEEPGEEMTLALLCLEKKGLICLDYDRPLKGYFHPEYEGLPLRGSVGLTLRGQQVLELIELQGVEGWKSSPASRGA